MGCDGAARGKRTRRRRSTERRGSLPEPAESTVPHLKTTVNRQVPGGIHLPLLPALPTGYSRYRVPLRGLQGPMVSRPRCSPTSLGVEFKNAYTEQYYVIHHPAPSTANSDAAMVGQCSQDSKFGNKSSRLLMRNNESCIVLDTRRR